MNLIGSQTLETERLAEKLNTEYYGTKMFMENSNDSRS